MTPAQHDARVRAWWAKRDARLRDPDGWLTLVGLHWLKPGENRFGAHPASDIVLRGKEVPPRAGSLLLAKGDVRLVRNGEETVLADDTTGEPTVIDLGTLRMYVIRRGERFGLRVRDHASPALARFAGMEHFAVDLGWRVEAQFAPASEGQRLEIVDVTGEITLEPTPGVVAFEWEGRTWRLDALPGDEDGSLWLIFGDATNGRQTYGGGRFLYSEPRQPDGSVIVDFNLAYNPPCVFSPFATCPLPPAQNRLALAIEAGERAYHV